MNIDLWFALLDRAESLLDTLSKQPVLTSELMAQAEKVDEIINKIKAQVK
jgi:hypothetical protein